VRLLFPPAGWIMFFNVDERFGYAEIYGIKDNIPQPIDPHQILETRAIGYDNIYRNVLSTVLSRYYQRPFCRYLDWKFPYFDSFAVTQVYYPSVTQSPQKRYQQVVYECP